MEKKISVIIPAYNAQQYIEKCLDSVLQQNFTGVEVIVVNDASTDETLDILQEYQSGYPELIKLINQKSNHRQGAARNIALREATGKYILFLDSDDCIEKDTLESTWNCAERNNADIVFFGYKLVKQDGEFLNAFHVSPSIVGEMTLEKTKALLSTSVVPWGKLIRRSLIMENQIFFPEDVPYEDHATTYLYYLYAKKTALVNKYLYWYNINMDSTSNASNRGYHKYFYDMSLLLVERINKRGFADRYADEIEYFLFAQMYILGITNILQKNTDLENENKDYIDNLLDTLVERCPTLLNNKYYIRYTSEQHKKIFLVHQEKEDEFIYLLRKGYFTQCCPNYMSNIEVNIQKIESFFNKIEQKTVLWGAGNYARKLVQLLKRIDVPIGMVVDMDINKVGSVYEGHIVKETTSIEDECLILVPYMGWIPSIVEEMKRQGKRNQIINFEALIKYDIDNPIEDYMEE